MKTQQKHTPGPWNIHPYYADPELMEVKSFPQPFVACSTVIAKGEQVIAEVQMKAGVDAGWPCVTTREEMLANAHLISCAPELLGALEELAPMVGSMMGRLRYSTNDDAEILPKIRAAISKARGEV